jgi:hypothetical protein
MDRRKMAQLIRTLVLFAIALSTASCAGGFIGDHVPQWAGGLPKDLPPRPGSPNYQEYRDRLEHPPDPKDTAGQPPAAKADGDRAAPAAAATGPRAQ